MMPILHASGVMTPGQFGPISRDAEPHPAPRFTRTMSSTGMPSVMQTISGMPASAASRIASAANGGGTKITLASAPVAFDRLGHRVEHRQLEMRARRPCPA